MGNITVKNGTPIGNGSLCESCSSAHIIRGYSESETLVFCTFCFDQPIRLPFKVCECSSYRDKNKPSWDQMEELAILVNPSPTLKPAGFRTTEPDKQTVASTTTTIIR
jgi:hypothetical protein